MNYTAKNNPIERISTSFSSYHVLSAGVAKRENQLIAETAVGGRRLAAELLFRGAPPPPQKKHEEHERKE